jgi:hypothetical protein
MARGPPVFDADASKDYIIKEKETKEERETEAKKETLRKRE